MKTAMSGQRIPIRSRIESNLHIYQAHRRGTFSNAQSAIDRHRSLLEIIHLYVRVPVPQLRILDLGCGQTAIHTVLFHAEGARATGIDIEVPTYRMNAGILWRIVRLNGVERAAKSLARHLLFDKKFFAEVAREYGKPLRLQDVDTRVADATNLPFEDSSFDFVYSMAVFEHIDAVAAAVRELDRVLSARGIAVITPHLFPSLSGGHSLEWIDPDVPASRRVPPWDHLREKRHPANTYLNQLRIAAYREIFHECMDVVKEEVFEEGAAVLTPDLESELREMGYTREDLLTRAVTFFVRKKRTAAASSDPS